MISPVVLFLSFFFLLFFVSIKILKIIFFIGRLQQFFLINSCFSSSSIIGKQKFRCVPHLHMCNFYFFVKAIVLCVNLFLLPILNWCFLCILNKVIDFEVF